MWRISGTQRPTDTAPSPVTMSKTTQSGLGHHAVMAHIKHQSHTHNFVMSIIALRQAVSARSVAPGLGTRSHQLRQLTATAARPTASVPLASSSNRTVRGPKRFQACVPLSASRRAFFALAGAAGDSVEVKISGMMCDGCTGRVEEALKAMDGVKSFTVNLEPGGATVELTDPSVKEDMTSKIVQAIIDLGFEAEKAA